MDLIYTDSNKTDVGIVRNFTLDHEENVKSDDNTFEIKTVRNINKNLGIGSFVYCEGTGLGGRIDEMKLKTDERQVTYIGRTWLGLLACKCISPPAGSDYKIVSGEIHGLIRTLITECNYADLFQVTTAASGKSVTNYQFDRYCTLFDGLFKLLRSVNLKLKLTWNAGKILIETAAIESFTNDEINSEKINFEIDLKGCGYNHIICLGKGELKDRLVVHRYINGSGKFVTEQYYTGKDEIIYVYDYSSAESQAELIKSAKKKLLELSQNEIKVKTDSLNADLGDKVKAKVEETGVSVTAYVLKKITTIENGTIKYDIEVGEYD